jgi:hypothetical protein
MDKTLQLKDIPDELVLLLAQTWHQNYNIGVHDALIALGFPDKLAYRKIEHLCSRGMLEYGCTPRYAWLTEKGEEYLKNGFH